MANRPHKIDLLGDIPIFRYLSKRHLELIERNADELAVSAGHQLTREGVLGHELFVIAEGTATVTRHGTTLASFGPGDFVGEMSLLDNEPGSATVTADGPMVLFVIGERQFHSLLLKIPELTVEVLKGMAKRLRSADEVLTH